MKIMKQIFGALIICCMLPFTIGAIRMRTAYTLTGLNAALSTVTATTALKECAVYLPDMPIETGAAIVGTYIVATTIPTFVWLRNRTPVGRLEIAEKKLKHVASDPLLNPKIDESDAMCMSRIYLHEDFPYIEAMHALQGYDKALHEIEKIHVKIEKELYDLGLEARERNDQNKRELASKMDTVQKMVTTVKDMSDYTKRLQYYNEKQAQDAQARAQEEQARAQKQIARAAWVSAFAKIVQAINPFKK